MHKTCRANEWWYNTQQYKNHANFKIGHCQHLRNCIMCSSLIITFALLHRRILPPDFFDNHFLCFWARWEACGILVPWPVIEPRPLAVRVQSPNHCTAREFPYIFHYVWPLMDVFLNNIVKFACFWTLYGRIHMVCIIILSLAFFFATGFFFFLMLCLWDSSMMLWRSIVASCSLGYGVPLYEYTII